MVDSIVIEKQRLSKPEETASPDAELVSWVMGNVVRNRTARDTAFKQRWDEYYRIWRGKWSPESRSRKSERSKLVAPATQMAVDVMLAEILEAVLSREQWFDVPDDLDDKQKEDAVLARDRLREDLYKDGIVKTLAEILTNGALYGQLNAKIVTEVIQEAVPIRIPAKNGKPARTVRGYKDRVAVYPVPVEPGQMVWDMSGPTDVDRMLGVAHEFRMPLHLIKQRQADGVFRKDAIVGPSSDEKSTQDRGELDNPMNQEDAAFITEWHGLVPKRALAKFRSGGDELALEIIGQSDQDEMVEAVVTIANEGQLLRAMPNPSVMDDRAMISEQFDTVPNRFMGRGVVEKAYNSQKGLDMEHRARADALAWINNPMLAADLNRLPPKQDLNVWPGKVFGTRGDPREILTEFRFGDVNASTFQQTQEYERMVSQSTGAMDPASLRGGVRDESAMGSGIAASGMIKRSKRTMFHVEEFLTRLLRRILWRKMQFDPDRYPQDYDFRVKGTIGIIAREVELAQMTQMLQFLPEGSGPQLLIVKSIFENSSSAHKGEMVAAIDAMLKPDPAAQQAQQLQQQLIMAEAQAKVSKLQAETAKIMADAGVAGADKMLKQVQAQIEIDSAKLERIRMMIDQQEVGVQIRQTQQQDRKLDLEEAKLRIAARKPAA